MLSLRVLRGTRVRGLAGWLPVAVAAAGAGLLLLSALGWALGHPHRGGDAAVRLVWCVLPVAAAVQLAVVVGRSQAAGWPRSGLAAIGLGRTGLVLLVAAGSAVVCAFGSAVALLVFLQLRGDLTGAAYDGRAAALLGGSRPLPVAGALTLLAVVPLAAAAATVATARVKPLSLRRPPADVMPPSPVVVTARTPATSAADSRSWAARYTARLTGTAQAKPQPPDGAGPAEDRTGQAHLAARGTGADEVGPHSADAAAPADGDTRRAHPGARANATGQGAPQTTGEAGPGTDQAGTHSSGGPAVGRGWRAGANSTGQGRSRPNDAAAPAEGRTEGTPPATGANGASYAGPHPSDSNGPAASHTGQTHRDADANGAGQGEPHTGDEAGPHPNDDASSGEGRADGTPSATGANGTGPAAPHTPGTHGTWPVGAADVNGDSHYRRSDRAKSEAAHVAGRLKAAGPGSAGGARLDLFAQFAFNGAAHQAGPGAHGGDGAQEAGDPTLDRATAPGGLPWGVAFTAVGLALEGTAPRSGGFALPGGLGTAGLALVGGWIPMAIGMVLAGPGLVFACGRVLGACRPGALRLLAGRALQEEARRVGRPLGMLCATAAAGLSAFGLHRNAGQPLGAVTAFAALLIALCVLATTASALIEARRARERTTMTLRELGATSALLRGAVALRSAAVLAVVVPLTALIASLATVPTPR